MNLSSDNEFELNLSLDGDEINSIEIVESILDDFFINLFKHLQSIVWIMTDLFESDDQLSDYLYNDSHKMITSHSQQKRICTVHINFDKTSANNNAS